MERVLLAHGEGVTSIADYGSEWLFLLVPLVIGGGVIAALFSKGNGKGFFDRVGDSLERATGLPAWSAAGIGMGILALVVAVVGFYWDVAWHIELGRDEFIFTPAHTAIMLGLALVAVAGITAIVFATHQRADTKWRIKGWRIPYASVPITLLGLGALAGFPLDELWHQNYGIDVTMWGPTHLVMISGASFSPLGFLLLYREGSDASQPTRFGHAVAHMLSAALVVGMLTWTGEFDFGVPQFQALYHPVLVMAGSAAALVAARRFLGPGGAISAALGALAIRGVVALALGAGLGLVIPRFPLLIGTAAVIEFAFRLTKERSAATTAWVTAVAVGIVGFITEIGWSFVWARRAWTMALFPEIGVAVIAAIVAALLGWAAGSVLTRTGSGFSARALILAGVALIVCLAWPLPRNDAPIAATITTDKVSSQRAHVQVRLDPADAAHGANWFETMAWQGGALHIVPLEDESPGVYRTATPIPVGGEWKTFIRLAKSDVLVGAAVYMPEDPEIGASEIPLEREKRVDLVRDTQLLMREATAGPAWPAVVAYSAIAGLAAVWIGAIVYSYSSLSSRRRRRRGRTAAAGAAA